MGRKKALELYIHIPFCLQKCLYCDFLSFRADERSKAEYMDQLRCEILTSGPWYEDYEVKTIFIGGGTPSSLEPEQITMLMQAVYRAFSVAEDAEITIEVNPGTRLAGKLPIYRAAGINRVSIGLQSANNEELKLLGRIHTFEDFLTGFQSARMAGFTNINVDLMSAIPGQSAESWRNTVRKIIMLKPEHISAYSLIVEEGTPFGNHYRKTEMENGAGAAGQAETDRPDDGKTDALAGWPPLADEEEERSMYYLTKTFLEEAGFKRYEISNYAKPGYECRHNIGYWTGVPYLGFGLGASSYVDGCRFSNETDMGTYLELDFSMDGLERLHGDIHVQSRKEEMEEFMFLGLRMTEGVSAARFIQRFGINLSGVYGDVLEKLIQNKLLVRRDMHYALTDWGLDVSNYVMSEFLLDE
ncbi:MAG: radical SAM family heme chaperone HemW [Lachnospiraceae bacterium]|nr:radical SAM family heme chaperone HemW [Lachnospiraceae bacterium]